MILFQSLLLVISTDDDDWAMLCFDIKSAVKVTSSPGCKIVVDDILVLHSALTQSLPPQSSSHAVGIRNGRTMPAIMVVGLALDWTGGAINILLVGSLKSHGLEFIDVFVDCVWLC